MKQIQGTIVLILLMALIFVCPLWSGITGKIAGTVIDKETGDPLPGSNVVIVGIALGAAADLYGQYTILHVPPGLYDVQVFVIGYTKVTVSAVRVRIDQTARVNFSLEVETIELGEVTIVAERTIIKEDVATSVFAVSDREIEALPVSNVDDVISLQAGIQDNMAIRGGEAEDVLFMIDGVTLRDPRNNEPMTRVALSAIKEISVERGGFNSEYGHVQSGLVNVVTKEGSKSSYHGSITAKVSPPAPKYWRCEGILDVHDPNSYWMRPYLDDAVCWTGTDKGEPFTDVNVNDKWDADEPFTDLNGDGTRTFWNQYIRDQYLSFVGWNAISQQLLSDNDPNNDLTPLGCQRLFMYETRKRQPNDQADYEIDAGFGGPVPFISEKLGNLRFFTSYRRDRDVLLWPQAKPDYVDYDWTLKLTSDITPSMRLRISSIMGNISTLSDNWNYGVYPRLPKDIAGGTGGSTMFNMFSNWAWCGTDIGHRSLAAKLTHTLSPKTFYEVSLEHFQRNYHTRPTALRDTTKVVEVLPGYWVDEYPSGYWPMESDVGVTAYGGIQASLARDFSISRSTTFKVDMTSQVNFNNLVKAGVEFVYNDLDMDYGFIQMQTQGETYGQHIKMRNFPIRAAAYIQDKLETKGFTMNAGLRLDYSNSRTDWWDVDPYDPFFISSKYNDEREFDMKKSKPQWQLSPRLGISHPITENSKLFFNYGHFKQMPQYETLFKIGRSTSQDLNSLGDPNLILAKTISYELGYDHILFNTFLVQLAGFYKDITNQRTQRDNDNDTKYISINKDEYRLTTSNRYEDIRGFELTLRKTAGRWFSFFGNYTYQVSTNGNFGSREKYQDPSDQKEYDEETTNLYQQRPIPAPYARANLNFHTPQVFGPALMGHNILGGFMLNLLLDWNQGGWTTFNPKGAKGIENNVQYVDNFDGTLRASKTFSFKNFRVQFLCDVTNLFNRLRLRDGIVDNNQDYRLSLRLPESDSYDNIPGNDKFGDYRKPGVEWQPMKYRFKVEDTDPPEDDVPIYYEGETGKYWKVVEQVVEGENVKAWEQMDKATIDQINKDKAYIFHPGASTWWFLNPRSVVFGIRVSFDLD